jgi:hypothetical protein
MDLIRCRFILTILLFISLCPPGRGVSVAQNSLDPSIAVSRSGKIGVLHAMSAPDTRAVLTVSDSLGALHALRIVVNAGMPGRAGSVSIAPGAKDEFLVAWEQNAGAASQVWCARYATSGERLGQPILAADSAGGMNARMPRIASGRDGRAVVAWQDYRNRVPDLRYQLFDPSLKKIGRNQMLAAYPGIPFAPVPTVSAGNDIAFVYQQTIGDTFHVCLRFAGWNRRIGKVLILDAQARNRAFNTNPDCVWLGTDIVAAVWKDYRAVNSDIYLQRCTRRGRKLGDNLRVNDDTTAQWQRLPRLAANDSIFCVVWEDYRNDPRNQMGDVYAQWYGLDGSKRLAANVRVNTSNEPTSQTAPAVVMDGRGKAAIVWCDSQSQPVSIGGRQLAIGESGRALTTAGGLRRPLK